MWVLWWMGLSKWMWGVYVKADVGWVCYGKCGVGLLRWMWGWYVMADVEWVHYGGWVC